MIPRSCSLASTHVPRHTHQPLSQHKINKNVIERERAFVSSPKETGVSFGKEGVLTYAGQPAHSDPGVSGLESLWSVLRFEARRVKVCLAQSRLNPRVPGIRKGSSGLLCDPFLRTLPSPQTITQREMGRRRQTSGAHKVSTALLGCVRYS